MENTTANEVHPFETAGLGKAPYRVIGSAERTFQACPGEPLRAGGCCKYCYTGIRYAAIISSADGVVFDVGLECVRKVNFELWKDSRAAIREMRRAAIAAKRAEQNKGRLAAEAESRAARKREAEERAERNERAFREREPETAALLDLVTSVSEPGSFPADYARRCMLNVHEDGHIGDLHSRECMDCKDQGAADALVRARLRGMRADIRTRGHVGTVGKRETFEAEYVARVSFDTAWGRTSIYKYEVTRADGSFALLTWKTNGGMVVGDEYGTEYGTRLKITATVKEHGDYKGTAQTSINRPKFVKA